MVVIKQVEGYESFKKELENLKEKSSTFIYFTGSRDPITGVNWCPDCVQAEPVVKKCFEEQPDTFTVLYVIVGERNYWRDPDNDFKKDRNLNIKGIPTLIKWGGPQRLEGEDLTKKDMVAMLLEDED